MEPGQDFSGIFHARVRLFAAYVVRPLCGLDYLQALTLTCSAIAAAAWFGLSVCAYRFFLAVAGGPIAPVSPAPPAPYGPPIPPIPPVSRLPALAGLILFNAGFFLPNALRLPMLISDPTPSILFAYDLPNILNAVLAMTLCRAMLEGAPGESLWGTPLSAANAYKHAPALACGLLIAYFTQFSITVASAIAAITAGSLVLFRLIRHARKARGAVCASVLRRCTFLDLFCLVLVVFWFVAACYDLGGSRYASLAPFPQSFSVLLGLYGRALSGCVPPWLWLTLGVVIIVNVAILARDAKKGVGLQDDDAMRVFIGVSGLSFLLLVSLHVVIFYVTSVGLDNRFLFGLVLYFYLILIVNALFLCRRFPPALAGLLPVLALLAAEAALAAPWMPRPVFYAAHRTAVVAAWLSDITEADRAGESEVVIITPTEAWPHPKDYLGDRLARTLFHHGVTSRHMTTYTEGRQ